MTLGLIAGNRQLPVLILKRVKKYRPDFKVAVFAFKGETSPEVCRYADSVIWLRVGELKKLAGAILDKGPAHCVMAGQISPWRIFRKRYWDNCLNSLVSQTGDFRPHSIFTQIISYLENRGIDFIDSTVYLKEDLAEEGLMNGIALSPEASGDISFGINIASRFVELDVGQTAVVKNSAVIALEAFEGTDRAMRRAAGLAGPGCVFLKFSKASQDMRFDVPVVGLSTLKLLAKLKAAALVLEADRVIILDKPLFLSSAKRLGIAVLGAKKARL